MRPTHDTDASESNTSCVCACVRTMVVVVVGGGGWMSGGPTQYCSVLEVVVVEVVV